MERWEINSDERETEDYSWSRYCTTKMFAFPLLTIKYKFGKNIYTHIAGFVGYWRLIWLIGKESDLEINRKINSEKPRRGEKVHFSRYTIIGIYHREEKTQLFRPGKISSMHIRPYSATPFRFEGGTRCDGSDTGSSLPSIFTLIKCIARANSSMSRKPSWS